MTAPTGIFDLRSILGAQIRQAIGARDYDPTTVNLNANLIEIRRRPMEAAALSTHLDRLTATLARVERTQTEMRRIAEIGQHHIQRVAFENAAGLLADALSGLGHSGINPGAVPAATDEQGV